MIFSQQLLKAQVDTFEIFCLVWPATEQQLKSKDAVSYQDLILYFNPQL